MENEYPRITLEGVTSIEELDSLNCLDEGSTNDMPLFIRFKSNGEEISKKLKNVRVDSDFFLRVDFLGAGMYSLYAEKDCDTSKPIDYKNFDLLLKSIRLGD